MSAALEFVAGIAAQALLVFLLAGAAFAVVVGLALVLDARRALAWNERLSRWVSTQAALRPLDEPRDIKRFVYRGHRVVGLLVIAGSLYALDVLTFNFRSAALARLFSDLANQGLLDVAFEALRLFLIVGNLAALGAGAALALRPSLLKGIESWADRYYAPRASRSALDEMRFQPDRWVAAHPRLAGVLVAAGGAYVLARLVIFANN